MAKGKEMETRITLKGIMDASVSRVCSETAANFQKLSKKVAGMEKAAALAVGAMTAAFAGLAVKIGKDCVAAAGTFEKQMSNVATLLDGDVKKRVAELGDEVLAVSNKTGAATDDLTDGLYNVISAFGDSADSIKIMETAAKAAVAGNATTTDSINLLSAVMKGYGDTSADMANKVADMAFQTVKLGQTTFPELAASMGKVIPVANAMGVNVEELFGYMATFTGVTGSASEVVTQMKGILAGFMKPGKEMADRMRKLGFASGDAMIKARGLQGSLELLRKSCKSQAEFTTLFGSQEALTQILAAVGSQADNVRLKTKAMYEGAGIAEQAFAAQKDNLFARWADLKNYVHNTAIAVGRELLPVLNALAQRAMPHVQKAMDTLKAKASEWITQGKAFVQAIDWKDLQGRILALADTFRRCQAWIGKNRKPFVALGKALLSVYAAIKAVQLAMKAWTIAQWALNAALAANPVGLVIAAIVALAAAGWYLYDNWDAVCSWFTDAWTKACAVLTDAWHAFAQMYPNIAKGVTACWEMVCRDVKLRWDMLCAWFAVSWEQLKVVWEASMKALPVLWDGVCDAFLTSWDAVRMAFKAALDILESLFGAFFAALEGDWTGCCGHLQAAWQTWVGYVCQSNMKFAEIANIIAGAFITAWQQVKDYFISVINSMQERIKPLVDAVHAIGSGLGNAWDSVKGSKANPANWFAAGGFTAGPSICGEAGTEAVISFDPAYRRENQGYLMTAAEMLGMTAAPAPASTSQTTYNLGGITFAPVIRAGEKGGSDIAAKLRACMPQLMDMIEEAMAERRAHRYV